MQKKEIDAVLAEAVRIMKEGGVILYPTDTIWGVGCDATNSKACDRLYAVKKRPSNKSLIVLIDSMECLNDYVVNVPVIAYDLIKGARSPLSIIYSEGKNLAKNVSIDKTVCIRVVEHDFCKEVIRLLGRPITSTSANLSGQPSALTYNDITEEMKQSVDYTVQLYHDVMSRPKSSTIIRLNEDNTFEIIRQ